jgi:fructan beta-fructosidase
MTVPRELKLQHVGKEIYITSTPVKELHAIEAKPVVVENIPAEKSFDIAEKIKGLSLPCRINLDFDPIKDFSIVLSNGMGEETKIGYDKSNNRFYIDRTKSGKAGFQKDFAAIHTAPRLATTSRTNISLLIDVSSVELFADDGLTVMTEIFFPNKPYNKVHIQSPGNMLIKKMTYINLKSIWQ